MLGTNRWKKAHRDPKAVGWIAFLVLVAGIGVGTLIFDRTPPHGPAQANYTSPR